MGANEEEAKVVDVESSLESSGASWERCCGDELEVARTAEGERRACLDKGDRSASILEQWIRTRRGR